MAQGGFSKDDIDMSKVDELILKVSQIGKQVQNTANILNKTKLKINTDTADVEKFAKAMKKLEESAKKNKTIYSHEKYYQSDENALNSLNKAWNKYAQARNDGKITSDLTDGSLVTDVLRYANAFEVLGGDLGKVHPQLKEFVETLRTMDKYSSSKGYSYTVENFKNSFSIFDEMKNSGVTFENGFGQLKTEMKEFLSIADQVVINIEKINNGQNSVADAFDKVANEVSGGAAKTEEAYKQAKERIALSREELERELISRPRELNSFSDYDILWDHNIDDELSDIEKWSKAVEKITEEREYALKEATRYQNKWANGESSKWYSNEDYEISYKRKSEDYLKYSDQLIYAQERLQAALKSYTPNAEGVNAESLNALVLLLQNLNQQIEQIRVSFGTIDDHAEFQSLLSSINGINTALTSMKSIFVDVGDGEEFSPLLSMINNMISSINTLKTAVDKIKLNINLDTSVNEEQALMKVEGRKQELLRAYQEQFSAMKNHNVGSSKIMSSMFRANANSSEVSRLNKSILEFDESTYDNIDQKIKAYESIIKRMKEVSTLLYNENIYDNMDKKYQKEVTRSKGNLSRAQNALGKNSAEELEGLFGKSNIDADFSTLSAELGEITTKLGLMVDAIGNVNFDKIGRGFQEESSIVDGAIDSEKSALNTLGEKIDEISLLVDKKTNAFRQEEQVVIGTSQSEISALEVLDGQLLEIINTIQMLQSSPIDLNIVGVEGDKNIIPDNVLNDLKQLKESLNGLNPDVFKDMNTTLKSLSIDESVAINIQKLSNAITNLKASLNNVSPKGTEFLNSIKELTAQGTALQNLVEVLNTTKNKLDAAKKAVNESKNTTSSGTATSTQDSSTKVIDIPTESKEWEKVKNAALEYKSVLGDIQKITYSMRQDKDGKKLKSYQVTGTKSSITIGENLNLVAQKETVEYTTKDQQALINATQQAMEWQERENARLEERNRLLAEGKAQEEAYYSAKQKERNDYISFWELSVKQIEENQKANAQSKYTQEDIDTAKALFQGVKLGNSTFDSFGKFDGSGKGTIKFIEQIGEETKETIVYVDDLNNALNRLEKGLFNSKGLKQTFETKNINKSSKKDKESKPSNNLKEVSSVEEAYNKLISSEERYQKLKARIDIGKATKTEEENFNVLTAQRDKYNEKIKETTTLTEKEIQLRNRYNQVSKEKKETVYDSIIDTANSRRVDEDTAWNEANRINEALKTTKNLMDQIRSSKLSIDGFDKIADDIQSDIDKLNKKLINGEIGQTGYTNQVNKKISGLNSIIDTAASIDEAKLKMRDYLETLNGGKVKIGEFNSSNNTLTAEFKNQKDAIQEIIVQYNKAEGTIKKVSQGAKTTTSGLTQFMTGLKTHAMSLAQYLMTFVSFYEIWAVIKQGVSYVRELDVALTEMKKVSDETTQSLKKFQDVSFDIASAVGTTAVQIQNSTADFMRLGKLRFI